MTFLLIPGFVHAAKISDIGKTQIDIEIKVNLNNSCQFMKGISKWYVRAFYLVIFMLKTITSSAAFIAFRLKHKM